MDHSYEEIRSVVVDILAGRESGLQQNSSQFAELEIIVARIFEAREGKQQCNRHNEPILSSQDSELTRDVFWDLFRQGIIILGCDKHNAKYHFFRISHHGKKILENNETYFFYDVSTYEATINENIPNVNKTTLIYLKEAMQAFRADCMLSSSVMLGVATEHTFLLLIETIANCPEHKDIATAVNKERNILPKINKFQNKLNQQIKTLPPEIKEDISTDFSGILSIIRNYRNQSGHPTGKIIEREQMYVLLNLFITYAKKMYQLMDYYKN